MITSKIQHGLMRGGGKEKNPLKFNNLFRVSAQTINKFLSCGGLKGFLNVEAFRRCCSLSVLWISSRLLMWDLFQRVNQPSYCLFISVWWAWLAWMQGWRHLIKIHFWHCWIRSDFFFLFLFFLSVRVMLNNDIMNGRDRHTEKLFEMTVVLSCVGSSSFPIMCLQVCAVSFSVSLPEPPLVKINFVL